MAESDDQFYRRERLGQRQHGSPVSSPNFNGTTPVAGTNGLNVTYQVTGSNVSAEVVGDGNILHFLNGIGTYTTPAGGGNLTGTLTPGQRLSASASTTIVSSGPIYDTTNLGVSGGTGIAAHVTYCNTLALATGGTCDMRAGGSADHAGEYHNWREWSQIHLSAGNHRHRLWFRLRGYGNNNNSAAAADRRPVSSTRRHPT